MNWQQVENYLLNDNRCVLPIGSVEQHAQLSLCVDAILSERVAIEAAQQELLKNTHTKRQGEPEDIAAAVLYFASEAAGWVSGQVLSVDGGRS